MRFSSNLPIPDEASRGLPRVVTKSKQSTLGSCENPFSHEWAEKGCWGQ